METIISKVIDRTQIAYARAGKIKSRSEIRRFIEQELTFDWTAIQCFFKQ